MRYNFLQPTFDAKSMGVAGSNSVLSGDEGAYLWNPAALGIGNHSSLGFGVLSTHNSTDTRFLGNEESPSLTQTRLNNISIKYAFPTTQGSFVVGASYNQLQDFVKTSEVNAFNERSSILNQFNFDLFYFDAAFQAFAIDSVNGQPIPIWLKQPFAGIQQRAQIRESGQMGEMALHVATEFQKNFFAGISLGFPFGSYRFERTFIETDINNAYTDQNINADVDNIRTQDVINADVRGYWYKLGAIYRLNRFHIGASYKSAVRLSIDETFDSRIQTFFDNGDSSDLIEILGEIDYKVRVPGVWTVGLGFQNIGPATFTASLQYRDFSNSELDFERSVFDVEFEGVEQNVNQIVDTEFQETIDYRVGVQVGLNERFQLRGGFAFLESPRKDINLERRIYTGGLSFGLAQNVWLDLAGEFTTWDDENVLFVDFQNAQPNAVPEVFATKEEVRQLRIIAGLRFIF